jgi:hypothetical protein
MQLSARACLACTSSGFVLRHCKRKKKKCSWGLEVPEHRCPPTVLIFLGSGTGVSGRVGVRSLDSSDVCFWMVSLDCTFGDRSAGCDFCMMSEGCCVLGETSPVWDFASRSPSCGLGGRSFTCGLGGKSESWGFGGRSPNCGLGGSSPGLGGKSPIWGLGASSVGFGGRSPGGGFCGNSANCDDFWKISGGMLALSRERWWLVSVFLSATVGKREMEVREQSRGRRGSLLPSQSP